MKTSSIIWVVIWILIISAVGYCIHQDYSHPEIALKRQAEQTAKEKSYMDAQLKAIGWNDCEFNRVGGLMTIRCLHSSTTTTTGGKYSVTTTVDSP